MFAATVVALVVILADLWSDGFVRSQVRVGAAWMGSGARVVLEWVANTGLVSSRRTLAKENSALRATITVLEERTALYAVLEEENTALRSMLSLPPRERGVTAPIVSSYRASPYGTILIGAGENGGIVEDSLILSGSGFVIGTVTDSAPTNSLVTTFFAPGNMTYALVSGVAVTVEGKGGDNARAEAPRHAKIAPGDIVVAPEYGGRPIGIIGEVVSESGDASQQLFIRLPVNLASLRFVYVIKSGL